MGGVRGVGGTGVATGFSPVRWAVFVLPDGKVTTTVADFRCSR